MSATKLLLRWMPLGRYNVNALTVYRIARSKNGALVYRIVERLTDLSDRRPDLNDRTRYAPGAYCGHGRPAQPVDLRRAAGFDPGIPDMAVVDWWDENLPLDTETWRRLERQKARAAGSVP